MYFFMIIVECFCYHLNDENVLCKSILKNSLCDRFVVLFLTAWNSIKWKFDRELKSDVAEFLLIFSLNFDELKVPR